MDLLMPNADVEGEALKCNWAVILLPINTIFNGVNLEIFHHKSVNV